MFVCWVDKTSSLFQELPVSRGEREEEELPDFVLSGIFASSSSRPQCLVARGFKSSVSVISKLLVFVSSFEWLRMQTPCTRDAEERHLPPVAPISLGLSPQRRVPESCIHVRIEMGSGFVTDKFEKRLMPRERRRGRVFTEIPASIGESRSANSSLLFPFCLFSKPKIWSRRGGVENFFSAPC